ncbi:MAG: DUF3299 domain-containing protein [Nitrospinae bacterium]|nr:DUF3299 domain-containing protein [Nitrospinota bacterium]
MSLAGWLKRLFLKDGGPPLSGRSLLAIGGIVALLLSISPEIVKQHQAVTGVRHLEETPGSVPWTTLEKVDINYITDKNRLFSVEAQPEVLTLNGKSARVTGFITPLEPGTQLRKFILARTPPTCFFCVPGTPANMVYVETANPVAYKQEPVTVEGIFSFDSDMTDGILYRLRATSAE